MSKQVIIDITVPNQTKYLGMVGRIGESIAYSLKGYLGNRRELAYHLNLVLTEALANAICHANNSDPDKEVRVTITASDRDLIIRVFDHGQGFDLETLSQKKAQSCDEGGRGIQIIHKLMDQVRYIRKEDGNVLEITKSLN
ncbi:serine/threonine-protein kinase RsbW [Desulfuromusa kysingii]|uniref:Serine/threonine-protein kinase RsbW n=1 Tax=Desulfuromusa kysingii TaxID=37625 RepID=A0A1H3YEV3_9BACT|nr:ATP-binding protein [Desulfuromusa kysingii]SEA09631.1 serine/threonine-protein kinase RsbW [Desulfuromusa kysingii]